MTTDLKSFQVYHLITGAPLPTATPTFLDYRDRSGASRPQPTIVHVANGVFAFSPTEADIAIGVCYVISTGAFPARYSGSIASSLSPFQVCMYENGAGALTDISATPPTLAFYKTRAGVDILPAPIPVNVSGGYLWAISPPDIELLAGCVFDVLAPTGAFPSHYAGDLLGTFVTNTVVVTRETTATTTTVIQPYVPTGTTSTATGIFQSDLCLQHAIIEGFKQLRSTPWLLDAVMRGITFDPLTSLKYGQKELDQLKRWFLRTEIPVVAYRLGGAAVPSVSLALVASNIDAATLGDIHYEPEETISDGGAYIIAGPFSPSYDGTTGLMTLPSSLSTDVFPGMVVMDAKGQSWPILSVESNVSPISFTLDTGILAPFETATIRAPASNVIESHESIKMKEAWSLGIHVNTEPGHLLFLHAVVSFVLLWGRETLLEARGFELTDFSSTDFNKNQAFDEENVWSRFINLNGITMSVWPKRRMSKILGVASQFKIIDGANVPTDFGDVNDLSWVGDQDALS